MRRPQLRTAVRFAIRSLALSLALALGSGTPAYGDDNVLAPDPHVRAGGSARGAVAPGTPASGGGDQIGLPTPVKPPRGPRVPPVWSPFDGPGWAGTLVQLWTGMQGTGRVLASRVHAH